MKRKIDVLGRLVVAKEIRKELKLNPGDYVNFELKGNSIILTKAKDVENELKEAVEVIKQYCQNEDCDIGDCAKCNYPLSVIRCGDEYEFSQKQKEIKESLIAGKK